MLAPAVLVIADEPAVWVGREGGLARTRKAKEQGDVIINPDVGRAVHREDASFGQEVVHHRKERFFDFAGVLRPPDEHYALGEADDDEGFGMSAVKHGVSLELGCGDDGEVRCIVV